MRTHFALGLLVGALAAAGCDPVYGLDVLVEVPADAQAALSPDVYPAQVVLSYGDPGVTHPVFFRIGLLCEAGADTLEFSDSSGGVGCANETRVSAWLLSLDSPDPVDCTAKIEHGTFAGVDFVEEPAWAGGIAFAGLHDECGNEQDTVRLVLAPPEP